RPYLGGPSQRGSFPSWPRVAPLRFSLECEDLGLTGGRTARTKRDEIARSASRRSLSRRAAPRAVDACGRNKQREQDVEEFVRNLNHCTAPRPRASRRRGMQLSLWRWPPRILPEYAESSVNSS